MFDVFIGKPRTDTKERKSETSSGKDDEPVIERVKLGRIRSHRHCQNKKQNKGGELDGGTVSFI